MATGMRRPSVRAGSTWLLAALLITVALLAACAPAAGPGNATPVDPKEAGRLYAQCMRANGVPDFPDPDANGQLRGLGHEQQATPTFRAATEACAKALPGGGAHR